MKLAVPIGALFVAVAAAAVSVAVWASVADAPWEHDDQGNASVLCQDALERRKAVEDALQKPVTLANGAQFPLSAFRGDDTLTALSGEVTRLESELRDIDQDIQRFCE